MNPEAEVAKLIEEELERAATTETWSKSQVYHIMTAIRKAYRVDTKQTMEMKLQGTIERLKSEAEHGQL